MEFKFCRCRCGKFWRRSLIKEERPSSEDARNTAWPAYLYDLAKRRATPNSAIALNDVCRGGNSHRINKEQLCGLHFFGQALKLCFSFRLSGVISFTWSRRSLRRTVLSWFNYPILNFSQVKRKSRIWLIGHTGQKQSLHIFQRIMLAPPGM